MAEDDLEAVARASDLVMTRIEELGMSPTSFAKHAKVDPQTVLRLVEKRAVKFRTDSMRKISEGLGWPPGALLRLVRGEDPDEVIPATQPAQPHTVAAMARVPSPTVVTGEVDDEIAAMSGRLHEMTPEQRARVAGYMDAIRDEQT